MTTHNTPEKRPIDLAALRHRLAAKKGKEFWRSLTELSESEEFAQFVKEEFPRQAGMLGSLSRRDFLKVLGASMALAGLTACTPRANGTILPYAVPPEQLVPGKPVYFASAMPWEGYAFPVLVKTEMGRPIKVDGNPRHPASQGGSNIWIQASILDLYDPERAKEITQGGQAGDWAGFTAALTSALNGARPEGIRILTGPQTSPSLLASISGLLTAYAGARWHVHSPVGADNQRAGAVAAFGEAQLAHYRMDQARVILSLDRDLLMGDPGSLRYARDFAAGRQPEAGDMKRLYVVESGLSVTGSNADHRLAVKPSQVAAFAWALAARLGVVGSANVDESVFPAGWLDAVAEDLRAAGSSALIAVGEGQPAVIQALGHAMNAALGAAGSTVVYTSIPGGTDTARPLAELAADLEAGAVDVLLILEGNPAYTAPADLAFGERIGRAGFSAYLGRYADETAALATWHIPAAHYLEYWGDALAFDGTPMIIQPVIEPLYGGKSPLEFLTAAMGQGDASGYDLVRGFWAGTGGGSESAWGNALSDGFIQDTLLLPAAGALTFDANTISARPGGAGLEILFEPDPTIWDGQFSNNAWLQELPKPLTKLTWDNAALVSPATAVALGINDEDLVELTLRGRSITAAVLVQPGIAPDTVVVSLGYGRTAGGQVQAGAGYNAYALRTSEAPWADSGLEVRLSGGTYALATTRDHQSMEDRHLVRTASLEEFQQNPEFAHDEEENQASINPPWQYDGYAWGMAINLNACIGCNACVIGCQSENNIPTVGKKEVENSREMHWLRIDRYFEGNMDRPKVIFQPVPCMHCEQAPCEPVCPVEATSHSAEGINEMTYNRCVGTRYCSNNCPYKVRRFNFFKYVDEQVESMRAMRNPDVSVRSRGVMEKCTYCVQRINAARIQADVEGRQIEDGEVQTACQQACPTNAIVFGDINRADSAVRALKDTPLNYALLSELGTRPRTTYLARVTNPNPRLQAES